MRRLVLMITIAVLGLGFIGFIVWFVVLRDTSSLPSVEDQLVVEQPATLPAGSTTPQPTATDTTPTAPVPTPGAEDRETVAGLAKSFAERYGSYTSASAYGNVRDSLPLMTASFQARSQTQIAGATTDPNAEFSATAARALRADLKEFDVAAGTARAEILLQVQKLTAAGQTGSVAYQTMVLTMAKVDGTWKVDSATTQPAQ